MSPQNYDDWFKQATRKAEAYGWQHDLAAEGQCQNRLIRIPTGMGKTIGVLAAWLYHRVVRGENAWPRRLVWCLPMRVLVEQTEAEAKGLVEKTGLLWDGLGDHRGKVGVHLLRSHCNTGAWELDWPSYATLPPGAGPLVPAGGQ